MNDQGTMADILMKLGNYNPTSAADFDDIVKWLLVELYLTKKNNEGIVKMLQHLNNDGVAEMLQNLSASEKGW